MVYDNILKFLGQQNFALTRTAERNITILRNYEAGREIYCVLIDSTAGSIWSPSRVRSINERLTYYNGAYNDVLFLVVTDNVERDRILAQADGVRLWIIDDRTGELIVYENQPEDFYGLRFGIAQNASVDFYPEGGRKSGSSKTGVFSGIERIPYVTVVLIAANITYFIILLLNGALSHTSLMLRMGANYGVYVFERFQYWRLISAMFMHFSLSHLAGNMLYLAAAGYNLEKRIGHLKFFLIYMLSGFGANLVSAGYYYLAGSNTVSAGASGAVYGLIGAILYITVKDKKNIRPRRLYLRIGIILVFLYYSNFTADGVDAVAHIAGLVFGFLLSIALLGRGKAKKGSS